MLGEFLPYRVPAIDAFGVVVYRLEPVVVFHAFHLGAEKHYMNLDSGGTTWLSCERWRGNPLSSDLIRGIGSPLIMLGWDVFVNRFEQYALVATDGHYAGLMTTMIVQAIDSEKSK